VAGEEGQQRRHWKMGFGRVAAAAFWVHGVVVAPAGAVP
jgi:hypothetical protein